MPAKLSVDETKVLKGAMSAVERLVEEATMRINPDSGLSLSALEPAKTAMIQIVLPKPFFSQFEVGEERFVGVNFTELMKVLKRAKVSEAINLILEEANLNVEIAGQYTRRFSLPLLSGEPFKMRELKVDFKAGLRVEAKRFPSMVKDLSLVGREVEIAIDESRAQFAAREHRTQSIIEMSRDDPVLLDLWAKEPSKSTYSLNYLERMSDPAGIAQDLSIELATNSPMKMHYSLGFEGAGVTYYLAHLSV